MCNRFINKASSGDNYPINFIMNPVILQPANVKDEFPTNNITV
jgi:hypothetical protein